MDHPQGFAHLTCHCYAGPLLLLHARVHGEAHHGSLNVYAITMLVMFYIMPGMTAEEITFPHQFDGEQVWVVESENMSNDTDSEAASFMAEVNTSR